jgi:hypothetical protein
MLRTVRIIGVVVFSILVGLSANRLHRLYSAGELFEQYNSERKANVTLLVFSVGGLVALGYLEHLLKKRKQTRHGYVSMKVEEHSALKDAARTSIYSAPETIDEWEPRRTRSSRTRPRSEFEMIDLWMRIVRICCVIFPVIYLYLLVEYFVHWVPRGLGNLWVSVLVLLLFSLSVITSIGFFRRKLWGIHCGYAIAVFHLLIFPIGTAVGLLMLVALAGVASEFSAEDRKRRRQARKEKGKNSQAVLV